MKHTIFISLVIVGALVSACQTNKNNSAWSTKQANGSQDASTTAAAASAPAASATSGKGVGPVDHVDMASLDESKKELGAQLFQEKCSACHKLNERYVGPALVGVTQRRQPEWILNMILNPEVMVAQDPTAKMLLAEFIAPMANQHLTREQAECILVYFREHDEDVAEGEHDDEEEDDDEASSAVGQAASGH